MATAAIEVENLVKSYRNVRAVDGISFRVEEGQVFGLLGPNGAGKTTTIEVIEGLRHADAGRVTVLGLPIPARAREAHVRMGAQLQQIAVPNNLTVHEILDQFGSFYPRSRAADTLLEEFGLTDKRDSLAKRLSGGQRQRLSLALALVNDPDLIFLDEPTAGLDTQARRDLWDKVGSWKRVGKTVILTTHYIEEAEAVCDVVAIVDHGHIIAQDRPQALIRSHTQGDAIAIRLDESVPLTMLSDLSGVSGLHQDNGAIVLASTTVSRTLVELTERLAQCGAHLQGVEIRPASLEDVFLELTGRRIRD